MQDQINILVVADNVMDRRAIRQALHEHYQTAIVEEVVSCLEAMQAILSRQFDTIIFGDSLVNGDGMNCFNAVREAGITTPIVLLTGDGDEFLAVETIQAGATVYLPQSDLTPQTLDLCLRSAQRFHHSHEQMIEAKAELHLRDRAIAAATNGIIICDFHRPDYPIIYCNPAFSAMTGYLPEEVIGRNCRFLQGPETDIQSIERVRACLSQESDCQVIMRNYRKDGTPFWNELTISPVRDTNGALTHFIGVQTDITLRRNAEDALRQNVAHQQAMLRDVFASVTEGRLNLCISEDDLPAALTRFVDPISLSMTGGIRELRRHTISACLAAGIPHERSEDMETAVGEAAMNAVVHSATGTAHVFSHERGTVQVRVVDEGKGISVADLPNATLRRGYSTSGTMGHGFKMMLSTVDRVHLLTSVAGTTVVIEQDRMAPLQSW